MSVVIVEDPAWKAILGDERLAAARRKLSFREIRLIVQHTREASHHAELVEALTTLFDGEYVRDGLPLHIRNKVLAALANASGEQVSA